MSNLKNRIVPYPLGGMIYFVETTENSTDAWVANKPIQYIDEEGYHCGWGFATLCFKFEDLNEVYFFSREEAEKNLGNAKEDHIDSSKDAEFQYCLQCDMRTKWDYKEDGLFRYKVCRKCGKKHSPCDINIKMLFNALEKDKDDAQFACSCYQKVFGKTVCYGTKEREECSCGGDKRKCNFYPEYRERG